MQAEAPAKEPCFLRSTRSAAFREYCERVYGEALNQYGTADVDQLELLLRVLKLTSESRVLDVGCGTGETTLFLARRSGAHFTGIDKAELAIRHAAALASENGTSATFEVANMDALEFPPHSFDAIVAIESLYFAKDLTTTIASFRNMLLPGGRMGLFFTHFGQSTDGPNDSKIAVALAENCLAFEAHDLTQSDRRFWQRSKQIAEEMRGRFAAEGNEDLLHLGETDAVLDLIAKGGHRRFLYHARKG